MTCISWGSSIVCVSPLYRLRLLDGRYIYMAWHRYLGPTFYRDRLEQRMLDDWWQDALICRAVEWFQNRGCMA
jgi:hypothetical protein